MAYFPADRAGLMKPVSVWDRKLTFEIKLLDVF